MPLPILSLAALLTLAACSSPAPVSMRNPVTGEVRQCTATPNAFVFQLAPTAEDALRQCVFAYQAAGWQRAD